MGDVQEAMPPVAAMVHHCCSLLRERLGGVASPQGLVVGCGNGDEVVFMERTLRGRVMGVDIEEKFSSFARAAGRVLLGDAESLPFPSGTFHFVAAYHSLEHVHDPRRALDEILRVLRPGGWFYMGVPNRSRLIGYLGSFDATLWQKIWWNIKAWYWQLTGTFRNELGAHAGFDRHELMELLSERFTAAELVTAEYVRFKYSGRIPRRILNALLSPSLFDYSAASHYAICQKGKANPER